MYNFTRCTSMKWRFEKQMAHQCSVKYKDLTLYAFLLYHQQVSNAQNDLIEKCLHSIVLLCLIWRNLYQIRIFADSINFLFSFEENCCGIIPITWRSLWWTCSIAKNVCTMVSAFQNWRFQCCRQRTRKTAQKVRRRGIASIAEWMIHKHKNNSQSNWALVNKLFPIAYERWERFRKSSDGCHMNWTRDRNGEAQKYMWNFARTIQKKVILASYRYWGWKVDVFWKSQGQKIMSRPRRTIHIDRKTDSLWQKDNAVCLVGPEECGLLWAIEAWRND